MRIFSAAAALTTLLAAAPATATSDPRSQNRPPALTSPPPFAALAQAAGGPANVGAQEVAADAAGDAAPAPSPAQPGDASVAGALGDDARAASAEEAETVWRAYEKRWADTADYTASFRQWIEVPDLGTKVESAGHFYFAKPGLVHWEYTEGPPQTVVGDGAFIWLYQPDLEQVYKIAYEQAFGRGGLVELLAGREGVSERYSASLTRPDADTVVIRLDPLEEGEGDLEVTLASETFDLRAVTVHDAAGSTTRMAFSEPLRNRGLDRDRFTFTPPAGVDIISELAAGF